jgi:hypothetical protein
VWAVAELTLTEGLRQPVFYVVFACVAALCAFAPLFSFFHLGEEAKMAADLGLSSILLGATVLCVLLASSSVTEEVEGRTALTMLAKPLRREEFLAGKFVGIACAGSALALLCGPVLMAAVRSQKFVTQLDAHFAFAVAGSALLCVLVFGVFAVARLLFDRGPRLFTAFWLAYLLASAVMILSLQFYATDEFKWDYRLLAGVLSIALHTCVVAAFAVALATRLSLVQSALGTAAFFLIGHASGAIVAPFRDASLDLSPVGLALRTLLPDLDQFNLTDALATAYMDRAVAIPADVLASSALYALLYSAAILAAGSALFARRELS